MERALKHVVVGLALGAGVALLLVGAGTVLLLSVVFGFCRNDADMLAAGVAMAWCYASSPFLGLIGFVCGCVGSMIPWRLPREAG